MDFLFIILSLHVLFVIAMTFGFQRALAAPKTENTDVKHSISVVIPFRNEGVNIERLLTSLENQCYNDFEVVLVDDHSSDDSTEIVAKHCAIDKRLTLMIAINHGKKNALSEGIAHARGEIVVTSDADCRHDPEWLSSVNSAFSSGSTDFVFGPVVIDAGAGLFERVQQLEFAGVIATGIGAFGLGTAVYCNGANVAFRKSTFHDVNGYEGNMHIASGDDEFLMKKVFQRDAASVKFNVSAESLVRTAPALTITEFLSQRLRWAGKWRHTTGIASKLMALFVFLVQIAFLVSIVAVAGSISSPAIKYLLGAKILIECIFLFSACQIFRLKFRLIDFCVLQLMYPFYILYIGTRCNFPGVTWKQRPL